MYWCLVCLAVSLMALPFAAGPGAEATAALIVAAVFLGLSLAFFLFARTAPPPSERARDWRDGA